MKFLLGSVENIEEKGENAGKQHFLLFLQCFQKASFLGDVKSLDCVVSIQSRDSVVRVKSRDCVVRVKSLDCVVRVKSRDCVARVKNISHKNF